MTPVAIGEHTKVGHLYAVCNTPIEWMVYRIEPSDGPTTMGAPIASFPFRAHEEAKAQARAMEYAEFLSGGGMKAVDAKFSALLSLMSRVEKNVQILTDTL